MKYMCDKKGDLACRWSRDNLVADDRYLTRVRLTTKHHNEYAIGTRFMKADKL